MRTIPSKIALGLLQLATATVLASACSSEVTGPSQPDGAGLAHIASAEPFGHRLN